MLRREMFSILRDQGAFLHVPPGKERQAVVNENVEQSFRGMFFDKDGNDHRETMSIGKTIGDTNTIGN